MDGHEIDFHYLKKNKSLWTYESFKYMVDNSYYQFATFIYKNTNLNMGFDTLFAKYCRNNDIERANFLTQLCDRYKLIIENEKIKYFNIDFRIDYKDFDYCPICFENKKGIYVNCNHFFCYKCFPNILLISEKCPMCRNKFN